MSDVKLNTETAQRHIPKAISEMSAPQPVELGTRKTEQSQVNVPDSNSMSLEIIKEERHQEETEDLVKQLGGEEEEKDMMENSQQMENNTALSNKSQARSGLKMLKMDDQKMIRDRRHHLMPIEKQWLELEICLSKRKPEIMRLTKVIPVKKRRVKKLELLIERENYNCEEMFRRSQKKSMEAKTLFEEGSKFKQEKNGVIEKLNDEIGTTKSEQANIDETLNDYTRYNNILFKLSPPEWQEAQELLKAEVLSDAADEQNREPQSAAGQGLECDESSPGEAMSSTREPQLSSTHSHTLTHHVVSSPLLQEKLELYFFDPQQLLDLVMELTDQNLSLIQNSTRRNDSLEELLQLINISKRKMIKDEERLTPQITDMKEKVNIEEERAAKLKQMVQLHVSVKTEDKDDVMLDALGVKVTEVHRCNVASRLTNLSTLEKLSSIEYRMSLLQQDIDSIPEEGLEVLRQLRDSERRTRLYEEKLRLEKEKQRERMKKCMERSMGDAKKMRGRKLMPRCIPVEQKIKVSDEDITPAEDKLYAYLFTTEDVQ
ncbi:cilia- and flagella-associated protein 100-like isoform X3 [Thunnus albacares]|uniref:cilia- and flagella-associated protein 100-like isoform X3 n=1 Tax=Thunnus albacares TaxID=8236 RepID=UPI001CF61B53|nr:cilia- and flagella-associated protein 100-like isoform X3 [Thunnus albacares]